MLYIWTEGFGVQMCNGQTSAAAVCVCVCVRPACANYLSIGRAASLCSLLLFLTNRSTVLTSFLIALHGGADWLQLKRHIHWQLARPLMDRAKPEMAAIIPIRVPKDIFSNSFCAKSCWKRKKKSPFLCAAGKTPSTQHSFFNFMLK